MGPFDVGVSQKNTAGARRWTLWLAVGTAFFLRVAAAFLKPGFRSMDEHWQVMEPAIGVVDGFWFRCEEWVVGARNWIYPWLVSWPLRFAMASGSKDPLFWTGFVRSAHALFGAAAVGIAGLWVEDLVLSCRGGLSKIRQEGVESFEQLARQAGLAAAWFLALWPYAIYAGNHAHGEMFGAFFVLCALWFLLRRRYLWAGAFFGMAFTLKIDLAVAGLVAGLWPQSWRRSLRLLLGAAPFMLLVGAVDRWTWGRWFHSVRLHAHLNLVEEIGNQWGTSPWYLHFGSFISFGSLPLLVATILVLIHWFRMRPTLREAWWVALGFVAVFAIVEHKEKRFIAPLVYVGPGLAWATLALEKDQLLRWWDRLGKWRPAIGVLGVVVFLIHFAVDLRHSLLDRSWEDRVRAMAHASQVPGVQKVLAMNWAAYFYYPRHLPVVLVDNNPENIRRETEGLQVVSLFHEGDRMDWMEVNGFHCDVWPPEPQFDPRSWKARAYRCVRDPSGPKPNPQ